MGNTQITDEKLEAARLEVIGQYSEYLKAEIELACEGNGFFEGKFWREYLFTKYSYQNATNQFYVLLHELSK